MFGFLKRLNKVIRPRIYYEMNSKTILLSISIFEFVFKHTKQIMQVEGKSHQTFLQNAFSYNFKLSCGGFSEFETIMIFEIPCSILTTKSHIVIWANF